MPALTRRFLRTDSSFDYSFECVSPVADDIISGGDQDPCPDCGEMVRKGLVRCWNCGAFMDAELEARFMAMQSENQGIIYSDPSAAEADDSTFNLSDDDSEADGGFELNVGGSRADLLGDLGVSNEPEAEPAAEPEPAAKSPDDEIFSAALSDMKESQARQAERMRDGFAGGVKTAGGFIIFCPYGCKIDVKEKHRGQMGKCPKCRAPFIVPVDPPDYVKPKAAIAGDGQGVGAGGAATGTYGLWIEDAHLHVVDPEKLKLKADSLVKDFQPHELVVGKEHVALVPLIGPKGGLFGGGPKKDELRAKAREAAENGPFKTKFLENDVIILTSEQVQQLKMVQPTKTRGESMFAGVPVFGEGRIAIQLPDLPGRDKPDVLSFSLTEFRKFSSALSDQLGISNFGVDTDVPLEDQVFEHSCHYSDAKIKALGKLDFYRADPAIDLILAGHQCAACGLVVSEDSRKKESLGGKSPKGIAKAKCPKCSEKMGDLPLYTVSSLIEDAKIQSET